MLTTSPPPASACYSEWYWEQRGQAGWSGRGRPADPADDGSHGAPSGGDACPRDSPPCHYPPPAARGGTVWRGEYIHTYILGLEDTVGWWLKLWGLLFFIFQDCKVYTNFFIIFVLFVFFSGTLGWSGRRGRGETDGGGENTQNGGLTFRQVGCVCVKFLMYSLPFFPYSPIPNPSPQHYTLFCPYPLCCLAHIS